MLDKIRESLKANSNLSDEFKDNLFELAAIFNESYPNISLDNLNDRLKKLKISVVSKFASKESIKYNLNKNELMINKEALDKEEDVRYLLMLGLLDIISLIDSPDNEILAGFRQGYAALIANNLVGNESELNARYDNMIAVNLLGHIVSTEALNSLFFRYNPSMMSEELSKVGVTNKETADLLDEMSYNATATSNLILVHPKLVSMFIRVKRTKEEIDRFCLNSDSKEAQMTLQEYLENMPEKTNGRTI